MAHHGRGLPSVLKTILIGAGFLGSVCIWWRPLLAVGTLAATLLIVAQFGRLFGRRTRPGVRLMEVAAFAVFSLEITWTAVQHNSWLLPVSDGHAGFPLWVRVLAASAYCSCILRLFLWEWYIEDDKDTRETIATSGPGMGTIDALLRLLVWFLILTFPIHLSKNDAAWPRLLGGLYDVDANETLLLINLLSLAWSALLFWLAKNAHVRRVAGRWMDLGLISTTLALVLDLVCAAGSRGGASEAVYALPAAYAGTAVGLVVVFWIDIRRMKYFTSAFQLIRNPE